jgi:hypothetical protein
MVAESAVVASPDEVTISFSIFFRQFDVFTFLYLF